jgi:uncharacterized membrane protein YdbT with pleckstrin-like domain
MKVFEIELHDQEKILMKVRQHWLLLVWPSWKFIFLTALGIYPAAKFEAFRGNLIALLLFFCWVLLVFNSCFHLFLNWYLNVYVVTNKRVINVTHHSLFERQTTEASLQRVQDVTHKTLGFLSMLFNYGDVIIQTAGHHTLIHFHMIPKPRAAHRLIAGLLPHHGTPVVEGHQPDRVTSLKF